MSQWTVGGVKNDLLCEDLLPLGQFPKPEELARVVAELQQISALQQEIARLTAERDEWKVKYQDFYKGAEEGAKAMGAAMTEGFKNEEKLELQRDTLKRENAALRQALEPFAECERRWMSGGPAQEIHMDWLTAAREALDAAKEQG
jgi:hypothetical protein